MSGRRPRVPAKKSAKKQRGVILVTRDINQARAKYFEVGIANGKKGQGLKYYVDCRCPPHQ